MRRTKLLRLSTIMLISMIALRTEGGTAAAQNKPPTIHNEPDWCRHEPDWRPSNSATSTLLVKEVKTPIVTVAIDCFRVGASADPRCDITKIRVGDSRWEPKVGEKYLVEVTYRPNYFNACANWSTVTSCQLCLGKELNATRDVCLGPLAPPGIRPQSEDAFDAFYKWSQKHNPVCYDVPPSQSRPTL